MSNAPPPPPAPGPSSSAPRRSLSFSLATRARSLGRGRPSSTSAADRARSDSYASPTPMHPDTTPRRRSTLLPNFRQLVARRKPDDLVGPQNIPRSLLERPLPPLPPPDTPPPAYDDGLSSALRPDDLTGMRDLADLAAADLAESPDLAALGGHEEGERRRRERQQTREGRERRERRERSRRDRPPAYDKPAVIMPKGLGLDLDFSIDEGERLARHLERDRRSVDL